MGGEVNLSDSVAEDMIKASNKLLLNFINHACCPESYLMNKFVYLIGTELIH